MLRILELALWTARKLKYNLDLTFDVLLGVSIANPIWSGPGNELTSAYYNAPDIETVR